MSGAQREAVNAGELAWPAVTPDTIVGNDQPRVDGPDKVRGAAIYSSDVRLPRMVYARLLCSPYPVARVEVKTGKAKKVDGVREALFLDGDLVDGRVRRLGQPVAVVAADTPEQAADGVRALEVEWRQEEWVVDREQALADDAPLVSSRGDSNVRFVRPRGDLDAAEQALSESSVVVDAVYTLPVQNHMALETHGVVVDYDGGDAATVYASTQSTFGPVEDAAKILELPASAVTVVVQHMGGGFGAKLGGVDVPGRIACMLAKRMSRPVHLMLTRADEFVTSGNRSGSRQHLRGGATADGTFKALVADQERYGGMGRGSVAGQPFIYAVEHSANETKSVLTNTDGSRAFRAPGHPQASFAIESMVDELAYGVGMSPLDFRLKNLENEVYHRQLLAVADRIGWERHWAEHGPPSKPERLKDVEVGIGFGVSRWGTGGRPSCEVDVRVQRDGSVTASVGSQDIGTGTRTYVAGIVADELGLPIHGVEARIGDSRYGRANASGGSMTVPCLAPAVKDAAVKASRELLARVAEGTDLAAGDLALRGGKVVHRETEAVQMSFADACALLPNGGVDVRGTFREELAASGVHGAQAARVEVDTLTGEYRVTDMAAVHDCGLALNPLATRSQIQGAMVQALSYGMYEERLIDSGLGLLLNGSLEEYRIAGIRDVPEYWAAIDEEDTRNAVLGIGEPPVIPGQSAIACAIYNACGVRLRDMPLSRQRLIQGLDELRGGGGR
jgi:xanthine dehydrogenase YagR molybdenum-binding subunit